MKQTEEDPWLALPAKYPQGTRITGVVRNLTSFGAFVEVEPGIDGLVHISDMSWTRRVQHPSEVVRKGEEVEVVVLSIDPDQKRISLGLKQVQEDPWYDLAQEYEPGNEVEGTVVRLLEKGVVVDLGDNFEGFVPISQLGVEEHIDQPSDRFVEGDVLGLKVLETDPINRRIVLQVIEAPEREAPEEEATEAEDSGEAAAVEAEAEATEVEEGNEEADLEPADPEASATAAPEAEEAEEAEEADEAEEDEEPEAEAEVEEAPEAEVEEAPDAEVEEAPEAEAVEVPEADEEEEKG